MEQRLKELFKIRFGELPQTVKSLGAHASDRQILRLGSDTNSAIGVISKLTKADIDENRAFVEFTRHFRKFGLPVPEVYAERLDEGIYLVEDLGDFTLYDILCRERTSNDPFPASVEKLYIKALEILPRFQIEAGANLDYGLCFQSRSFNREAMLRDMYYFRNSFLKRTGVDFDTDSLEISFQRFADFLAAADAQYFMYRDFQARNIMIKDGEPHFIDYQRGRHGALQYDVAAMLYQSSAEIPVLARERLLEVYLSAAQKYTKVPVEEFKRFFDGFVLLRMMQVLGTYGLRGLEEGKQYFIDSIPKAVANLRYFLHHNAFPVHAPELVRVFERIVSGHQSLPPQTVDLGPELTVRITSFSYKTGIPADPSGNGGGFVFDCRAIPNPGRLEKYRCMTGCDPEVRAFLEEQIGVTEFFANLSGLIDQAVAAYQSRHFSHLQVSFGCTGGQHRSVYFAELLAKRLRELEGVKVQVIHTEFSRKGFPGKVGAV